MRITQVVLASLLVLAGLAAPASSAETTTEVSAAKCVTVLQGGDIGERFCVDDQECLVSEYRTTFLGTERYCTVPRPGGTAETTSADATKCVATYAVSKYGSKYCVSTEDSCVVSEYRTTIFGTAYYCHVRR